MAKYFGERLPKKIGWGTKFWGGGKANLFFHLIQKSLATPPPNILPCHLPKLFLPPHHKEFGHPPLKKKLPPYPKHFLPSPSAAPSSTIVCPRFSFNIYAWPFCTLTFMCVHPTSHLSSFALPDIYTISLDRNYHRLHRKL